MQPFKFSKRDFELILCSTVLMVLSHSFFGFFLVLFATRFNVLCLHLFLYIHNARVKEEQYKKVGRIRNPKSVPYVIAWKLCKYLHMTIKAFLKIIPLYSRTFSLRMFYKITVVILLRSETLPLLSFDSMCYSSPASIPNTWPWRKVIIYLQMGFSSFWQQLNPSYT